MSAVNANSNPYLSFIGELRSIAERGLLRSKCSIENTTSPSYHCSLETMDNCLQSIFLRLICGYLTV